MITRNCRYRFRKNGGGTLGVGNQYFSSLGAHNGDYSDGLGACWQSLPNPPKKTIFHSLDHKKLQIPFLKKLRPSIVGIGNRSSAWLINQYRPFLWWVGKVSWTRIHTYLVWVSYLQCCRTLSPGKHQIQILRSVLAWNRNSLWSLDRNFDFLGALERPRECAFNHIQFQFLIAHFAKNCTCYKISIGDLITRKRFCKRYANLLEPDIILFISASAFQRTQDIEIPIIRTQGISIPGPQTLSYMYSSAAVVASCNCHCYVVLSTKYTY